MKTFEERYTAWIDGELEGNALVAFEQELACRATVSDAYADKADAMRLSSFLHDHLQSPALTNADFFNHQLRERIAGERAASQRANAERSSGRGAAVCLVALASRLDGSCVPIHQRGLVLRHDPEAWLRRGRNFPGCGE